MAYTNINDPSKHFQVATYSGTGSAQSITNDGNSNLQPDWIITKNRTGTTDPMVNDSSRGVGTYLFANRTNAEATDTIDHTSFNSDGFSVSTGESVNDNGDTFVAWQWKANGGTTSSNTDGYLTSTVQANTTAGFSIVLFTADGNTRTVGHGLGAKPDVIWVASRNVAGGFLVITDAVDGSMDYGVLRNTNAFASISYNAPTSTVFEYNDNNTNTQVAYCFAQKQGYSKFASYTGNGNANGTFVFTGFKPRFIMVKRTDAAGYHWRIYDTKRSAADGFNPLDKRLQPNLTEAEGTHASDFDIDALSNGFKLRTSSQINVNNGTYFYMAFAENPFVTSTGIPTTAR
jgi:hypothetical protein|tara:strand:+ start:978 stop:2012 length:1035 start_codon:yes stop_codon:yes gene_type:complete